MATISSARKAAKGGKDMSKKPARAAGQDISRPMVGSFHADYSELAAGELAVDNPEMDTLLRNSRVISEKRGL